MTSVKSLIVPKYIFGINTRVGNHIHFLDDKTVLYTAGNYLILHNIETAVQKFIPIIAQESVLSTENPVKAATRFIAILQENEEKARRAQRLPLNYAMNTMQVSPDKNLVALAHHYNGDLPNDGEVGVAIIQIIDLKKMRQTAILRTSITTKIINLEFTRDCKFLVGLTEAPDYEICVWSLERAKLMARFLISDLIKKKDKTNNNDGNDLSICGIAVNPTQNFGHQKAFYQICIYGNRFFRLVKFVPDLPSPFKVLGSRSTHYKNYVCHEWFDDGRILLGTDDGSLVICDMMESKVEIHFTVPEQLHIIAPPVSLEGDDLLFPIQSKRVQQCRIMKSKAIFICTGNGFVLSLEPSKVGYRLVNTWNLYKMYKYEKMGRVSQLLSLALSPTDDAMICTTDDNQIFAASFGGKYELGQELDTKNADSSYALRNLHNTPFHEGPIVDLEMSSTNSTLITCSTDKSIKFWDLSTKEITIHKLFDEEPTSVSLHVSNFYLLVAFKSSVKLFQIVDNSLQQIWSILAVEPRFCKFSNGGQFFMAAFDGVLNVYSTWFQTRVGMIGSDSLYNENVYWRSDDKAIITVETTGNICEWLVPYEAFEEPHVHDPNGLARRGASRKVLLFENPGEQPAKSAFREFLFTDQTKNESCLKSFVAACPVGENSTEIHFVDSDNSGLMKISRSLEKTALISGRDLVGFTSYGSVIYCAKGTDSGDDNVAVEVAAHISNVAIAKISPCMPLLISTSLDRTMIIFSLRGSNLPKLETDSVSSAFQDILIVKEKYVSLCNTVKQMSMREKQLQEKCTKDQASKDQQLQYQFSETLTKQHQDCRPIIIENESLVNELNELRQKSICASDVLHRSNQQTLHALRTEQEQHLDGQRRRYETLQALLASRHADHLRQVAELKYLEQNETDILNEKGKQRLDKKKDEIDQLKSAINRKQQELYTFEAEVNEQVESEILEIANLFETELRKEMQQTKSQAIKCDQLSAEHGALVKQTASAVQEKTSYQKNVEDLKLIVHNLKQDLANLDAELKQRHQTELDEDEQIEQLMRDIRDAHKLRFLMQKKYDAETKLMEPRKSVHDKLTSQTDGMRKECEMQSKALKEYRRILTESRRKLAIIRKNVNRDRLRRYGFSVFMKCMMADLEKLTADGGNDNSRQIGRDATDFYHRYVHLEQIGSINSPPKGYITDKQVSVELEDFVSKTITNLPILINVDTLEFTESGAVASVEIKDKIAELIMEKIGYQDFNRDAARHRQYFDRSMIELKDRMIKSNDMVKRERYKMIQERYETLGEMADVKKARL